MLLEQIRQQCLGIEHRFPHKAVLFIGSESYDAPTITVLEGLSQLDFTIYVLHKPNINSWFCNAIIDRLDNVRFDFVLSNLHWGTRWQYYPKYGILDAPKVLVDGDDNRGWASWREKYEAYSRKYILDPPEELKDRELMPFRWIEPIGEYNPDIVFTAQKQFGDDQTHYLPFGIHSEYVRFAKNKPTNQRAIDFAHILGPGRKRRKMEFQIRLLGALRILPGTIYNGSAYGNPLVPEPLKAQFEADKNVHSYHRWSNNQSYFDVLNNSKVLLYPGIDTLPFWDSKRLWEAYACGCLVLFKQPNIDVKDYPVTELCDFAVYSSSIQLMSKCRYLYRNPEVLDALRKEAVAKAREYFSPLPLARYFLRTVASLLRIA